MSRGRIEADAVGVELVADKRGLEYRPVGWFRGLGLAMSYHLPPIGYPKYHVRVRFRHAVTGPLAIGAGRYRGFGLFASDDVAAASPG